MAKLDKDELELALMQIVNTLVANNALKLTDDNKKKIIQELSTTLDNLDEPLQKEDLADTQVQKKLMGLVVSHVLGAKDMENKLIESLNSANKAEEIANFNLDKMLPLALGLAKLTVTPENNHLPKLTPSQFAKKLTEEVKQQHLPSCKNDKIAEKKLEEAIIYHQKLQAEALMMIYGGDLPYITGEIQGVAFRTESNQFGYTNNTIADPNSTAMMTNLNTYNANKLDPAGLENSVKNSTLESVGTTLLDSVAGSISDGLSDMFPSAPSPLNTRNVH